jgi:hypothetical protein
MELLETRTMIGLVEKKKPFQPFLLNAFFRREIRFTTKKVDLEKVIKSNRLAPLVSPVVAGRVMTKDGGSMMSLQPAYVKPKDVIDPEDVIERMAGEEIGGVLSPEQRALALKAKYLVEHEESILRREEWMAAQLLVFGKFTLTGDDYPTVEVDFKRSAENTPDVSGGARDWSTLDKDSTIPEEDMEDWMSRATNPVDMIILNNKTYRLFTSFDSVKEKVKTQSGSKTTLETSAFNGRLIAYMGNYGEMEIWVYTGAYDDDEGTSRKFIPDGYIVFANSGAEGVRLYGAILDPRAGYQALRRFPKNWISEDPAAEFIMTQSSPLVAMPDPDEVVSARVY